MTCGAKEYQKKEAAAAAVAAAAAALAHRIPLLHSFNAQSTDAYRAAERVLALDVAGMASSAGGTAAGKRALSRPDRLDRLQRRLGFAPLPFVCLIWNFVSNMWPNVSYQTWVLVYLATIAGLLPVKVRLKGGRKKRCAGEGKGRGRTGARASEERCWMSKPQHSISPPLYPHCTPTVSPSQPLPTTQVMLRWALEKYAHWRLSRLPAELCQMPAAEPPASPSAAAESQTDTVTRRQSHQQRNVDPYGMVLGPSDRFGRSKKPHLPLEEVDRFTMTSRII